MAGYLEAAGFEEIVPVNGDKYDIVGADSQIITIKVEEGEQVQTEPGTMMMMSPGIKPSCITKDCMGRCIGGEPCFNIIYTAESPGFIGLTPNFPGKVVPVDLGTIEGNKLLSKDGAYMASYGDVTPNFDCNCACSALCDGQGCVRQSISGEGVAFLAAGGHILKKTLADGEKIYVDPAGLMAWEESVQLTIHFGGICCCVNKEAMFQTELTGPGTAYLQTMGIEKFKNSVANYAIQKRGGNGYRSGAPAAHEEMDR